MTECERLQELLYRLREIMPEIGENPVADEMYNMVFEYAENIDEDVVEVVRCKDCIHHRQLRGQLHRGLSLVYAGTRRRRYAGTVLR